MRMTVTGVCITERRRKVKHVNFTTTNNSPPNFELYQVLHLTIAIEFAIVLRST